MVISRIQFKTENGRIVVFRDAQLTDYVSLQSARLMQDCSRIFCEVSISNLHHYDIYLVLAASEGEHDPQSSQGSHRKTPATKTGTSGLRQIQREPNPLVRPWKSHRVTRVSPGVLVFLVEPGAGARCGWSRKQADSI